MNVTQNNFLCSNRILAYFPTIISPKMRKSSAFIGQTNRWGLVFVRKRQHYCFFGVALTFCNEVKEKLQVEYG